MVFTDIAMRSVFRCFRAPILNSQIGANTTISYHLRRSLSSKLVDDTFNMAVTRVSSLRSEPGNETKLKLYALYKQSTVGPCNVDKPGMLDVVAKYKWEAWTELGSKSKEESMKEYISMVENLIKSIGLIEDDTENSNATGLSIPEAEGLVITNKQGVLTLRLNRPEKKNSLLISMYRTITKTINDAAKDDNIKMIVITGTGDFFSSGNDITNFQPKADIDMNQFFDDAKALTEDFVNCFIECPKPLMAVINGPAYGIMVTTLALYDNVICSDKATFQTPFLSTSLIPEGCSSYTFPRIMGTAKANAMLLFNQPMTAQEAFQCNFVSKVIPHDQLNDYVDSFLYGDKGLLSFGSTVTWRNGKPLIRTPEEIQILKKVNQMECQKLRETYVSPDFIRATKKFLSRKK